MKQGRIIHTGRGKCWKMRAQAVLGKYRLSHCLRCAVESRGKRDKRSRGIQEFNEECGHHARECVCMCVCAHECVYLQDIVVTIYILSTVYVVVAIIYHLLYNI